MGVNAEVFHLIPADDATSHTASVDCPCVPVAGTFHRLVAGDATVWTHHVVDGRGSWTDK